LVNYIVSQYSRSGNIPALKHDVNLGNISALKNDFNLGNISALKHHANLDNISALSLMPIRLKLCQIGQCCSPVTANSGNIPALKNDVILGNIVQPRGNISALQNGNISALQNCNISALQNDFAGQYFSPGAIFQAWRNIPAL
jgi:hypothetical protein